jgi:hypothetical protein
MAKGIGLWLAWRLDSLLPGAAIPIANRMIDQEYQRKIKSRSQQHAEISGLLENWPGGLAEARLAYDEELKRREGIEGKAISLVGASGVTSGLITAAGVLGILVPHELPTEGKLAVGFALVVPLASYVVGFVLALFSWRVGSVELVGPATLRGVRDVDRNKRDLEVAAERVVATELNQLLTLKRVNYLTSAESWMLRGTLLIGAAAITLLILASTTRLLSPTATKPAQQDVVPTPQVSIMLSGVALEPDGAI